MKILKKPSNIAILGILLGVRIVLQLFFSWNIGPTVISLAWVMLIVVAFIYGPIIGFFFGVISDTIGYLLRPGIYMWEYAIQEPLIGVVVGLISLVYWYTKTKKWVDFLIFETFIIVLLISSIILLNTVKSENIDIGVVRINNSINKIGDWILSPNLLYWIIGSFFVASNIFLLVFWKSKNWRLFIYVAISVFTIWLLFALLAGPWSLLRYWNLKYGIELIQSNYAITYLYLFIIRIFKAVIVIPIETSICFAILLALKSRKLKVVNYW